MMKRKILFLLLFTLSWLSNAQSKDIRIHWDDIFVSSVKQASKRASTLQSRAISNLNFSNSDTELKYNNRWEDSRYANPRSLRISNEQWEPLTAAELKEIKVRVIPTATDFKLQSSKAREKIYTTLSFSPIIKRNGTYQKLVSFTLNYDYGAIPPSNRMPVVSSVLSSGEWFRFRVDKTGVYKIDKSFLDRLGMNTNAINPNNLKIYGHGGKPLRLANDENFFFDVPEVSIQVFGAEDGSFDGGDYILFYGIGVFGYDAENDSNLNPYSDEAYYYITADGGLGNRIATMIEPSGTPSLTLSSFQEQQFHEEDEYSPVKVGRQWFGNRFDIANEQSYEFTFPNILSGQQAKVKVRAGSSAETSTSLAISVNSTAVNPLTFGVMGGSSLLDVRETIVDVPASNETIKVDLTYNNGGNPSSIGYLDYILIEATRNLSGTGSQIRFYNNAVVNQGGIVEYNFSNAANYTQIWDVTEPVAVTSKLNEGNAGAMTLKANMGSLRTYIAVHPSDYYQPIQVGDSRVSNQDLKGTILTDASGDFQDVDYLIITHPILLQPALRLAMHHKDVSGLRVKVVTTDKIYNEFSTGKQDIGAIRNFVRYVYDNASDANNRLKYLCLMGDTSVDMKNRLSGNNNMIPTYHTVSSTSTFASFMSDDYFGMLDIDEGTVAGTHSLDVAVGRIVTDNVQQANSIIDKITTNQLKASYGNWRNTFVIISDDVDINWEYKSIEVTLDSIADKVSAEKPFINVKKIHTDAYQQETSAGGNRYPVAKQDIQSAIEVGALVVNYFGHGGEDGLAKEYIFTKETAQDLRNDSKYPCFITVTCEFSRFDNPQRITAGELTFWNAEGGAASMITTTRSISVSLGVSFNKLLSEVLFGIGMPTTVPPAEALRLVKNVVSTNDNKRVVFFIGDPAAPLAFPDRDIKLRTINDVPIGQGEDVLKALSHIKMTGEVTDLSGNTLTDYQGILEVKVYDKELERETLANDGIRDNASDIDGDGDPNNLLKLQFKTLGEILFNGQASINNGQFSFEFIVPRDTQIPIGNGKVSLYAQRNNALEDQTGYNLDIQVGGLNENAPADTQGPFISLFMNDESFVSGGITNDSPILIAKLNDDNGINTSSGIGHDIIAILDGDEANPFVLNEYYQANVDDYSKGKVNYKLRDLEKGLHTLTVKAWDTYNNSNTADIQFVVAGDDELKITRVLNYPNPFVNYTEFWFNHNRPFEPLEVQVQVFTVSGKVVWTKNQIINTDGFLSREIVWDGKDDFGDAIGKGVYVYKLTVKSTLTGKQVEKFEKLVIL